MSQDHELGNGTSPLGCAFLLLSDSFCDVWPRVTPAAAGAPMVVGDLSDLPCQAPACLVVVCAGVEGQAPAALRRIFAARPDLDRDSVAVVGLGDDHRKTVEVLGTGVREYFALPGELPLLRKWLAERWDAAVSRAQAASVVEDGPFAGIIGQSPVLRSALDHAQRMLRVDRLPILIGGETGTGKQGLAEAIHQGGPRRGGRFVQVNCANIPADLMESELFGHEKGAFTGATAVKPGLVETADGGTLFLDEIGDLPFDLQAKLLSFLSTGEARRVGATDAQRFDVRIISATHIDLEERVSQGRFREDLLYRLNVLQLHLPPLRERGEDIVLLAEHFAAAAAREYSMQRPELGDDVRALLMGYSWPGNVRELSNAVNRAIIMGGAALHAEDFDLRNGGSQQGSVSSVVPVDLSGATVLPFPVTLGEATRRLAQSTLDHFGGNKSQAALALGITRKTLYALLADGVQSEGAGD